MNTKKQYIAPALNVHGDVEQVTQSAGYVAPTDVLNGLPDHAFPLS